MSWSFDVLEVGLTSNIGVSLRIFCRIFGTRSLSPETQTFVTKPCGRRWSACVALGSEEVTTASTRPPLWSLICLQSFLRFSTLVEWTGSLWMGVVASSIPTGNVHFWKAPGLLWRTSSTSGPIKVEEKGTLKERFAVESTLAGGRLVGGSWGRRLAISWWGLVMPKVDGLMLSQPWAVKLLILCIFSAHVPGLADSGRAVARTKKHRLLLSVQSQGSLKVVWAPGNGHKLIIQHTRDSWSALFCT